MLIRLYLRATSDLYPSAREVVSIQQCLTKTLIGAAVMSLPGFTGAITRETLAGIQFGRPQGDWVLFDLEPLVFG